MSASQLPSKPVDLIKGAPDVAADAVAGAVPVFTKVEDYTTFFAEYAIIDNDIVLHFFYSKEIAEMSEAERDSYWLGSFPAVLSPVSEAYFKATRPRIAAKYIPEMTSWWMRCNGFASRLGIDDYVKRFLEKLDESLEAAVKK